MPKYTATKAVASGVGANLVVVAVWLLSLIPHWSSVPAAPQAAIQALVVTAIGFIVVFFAPPNTAKPDPAPPSRAVPASVVGAVIFACVLAWPAAGAAQDDLVAPPEVTLAPAPVEGTLLATALQLVEECGQPCLDQLSQGVDRETTFGLRIRPCRFFEVVSFAWLGTAAGFATGQGVSIAEYLPPSISPYVHHPMKLVMAGAGVATGQLLVTERLHAAGHHRAADIIDCTTAATTAALAYKFEQLVGLHDPPPLPGGP